MASLLIWEIIILHIISQTIPNMIVFQLPTEVTCYLVHPWLACLPSLAHFLSPPPCFLGPPPSELLVPTSLSQGLCLGKPTLRQQCWNNVTLEGDPLLDLWALPVCLHSYAEKVPAASMATQSNIQLSLSHLCILFSTLSPSCWNLKALYHLMIFFLFLRDGEWLITNFSVRTLYTLEHGH